MSNGVLLDGLLLIAIALYVPIGALRGGLREAILGGSIFLGVAVAVSWPNSWRDELKAFADLGVGTASYVVFVSCLIGSMILLGFGGGSLCDRRVPSWSGRLLGAVLAAVNATVLTAFLLVSHERIKRGGVRGDTVTESFVAAMLIDHLDLVLLLTVGVVATAVVVGHVTHRFFGVSYDGDIEPALTWLRSTRRPPRSVRIPAESDAGKVEPGSAKSRTRSPKDALRTTRPLRVAGGEDSRRQIGGEEWSALSWRDEPARDRIDSTTNVGGTHDAGLAELHRLLRMDPAPGNRHGPVRPEYPDSGSHTSLPLAFPGTDGEVGATSETAATAGRCRRCDSVLPDPTLPCPFCDDHR